MLARKENNSKVLLKMGFLVPKTLRMKILELRLFKKLESEKLFLKKDLESYFQNQKGEIGGGMWPKGGHAKTFSSGPRERLRYRDQWYCWACHNSNQDRIPATYSCN